MAFRHSSVFLGILRATVALPALVALVPAAQAQEVTGTIRGEVTDDSGTPIAGARVTVVHVPSGTRSSVVTNASGSFSIANLRIGGPFDVTVEAPGFDSAKATITNLTALEPQRVAVFLVPEGQTIEVTGTRAADSSIQLRTGPATVLTAEDIAGVSSVNRDIRQLAVRDPLVTLDPTNGTGAISIAGQNNRFNRITVDGIAFGDPFGLEAGGLASARGPVPLDAIGEFTVQVAPVDIQQGNFQGGAVNTVLKSGGNQLGFTGFFSWAGDELAGTKTLDRVVERDFTSQIWGVQLTGPIIKDRLFFAVTYEQTDNSTPALVGIPGEGFGNEIAVISRAQVDRIKQISNSIYNYDPLDIATNVDEADKKLVAKVDWNLAERHRIALTYIYNEGDLLAGQTGLNQASGPNPNFSPILSLQSNNYKQGSINHYGVFQMNSDWTDFFSTQVRVSYNDYERLQVPYNGRDFGQFQVCLRETPTTGNSVCPNGVGRISFGPDVSRQANELSVDTFGVEFLARIRQNNHDVKIIAERRQQDFNNLFAQNVSGNWRFDSIADFEARRANFLVYSAPVRGDIDTVRAIFTNTAWTFGGQDSWDVLPDLTIVYGFRYDLYESPESPLLNEAFVARYGFANNSDLNGRGILQPRFGANWRTTDRLTLSGSAGLFAGGSPNVWISNSYSNPGPLLATANITRNTNGTFSITGVQGLTPAQVQSIGAATMNNVSGGTGVPVELIEALRLSGPALATTNVLDPNFELPSQWRIAGSADYRLNIGKLGDDWLLGGDIVWSRVKQALTWTDLRSVRNTVQATLPDGRPRYQPFSPTTGNNQDVLLTNTDKGYSWNIVARIDKAWDAGLNFGFAYTFQRANDVNPGTSSVALSNYNNAASADPNNAAYGTSIYQRDNSFRVNLGYQNAIFGDNQTRFDFFFNSVAGQRYSHTFQDNTPQRSAVFGTTGTNNRYLIYVPDVSAFNADPRVTYANQATFEAFRNFVLNSELADYQGQIAPKNLGQSPRFNKLDLRISQEVPFFLNGKWQFFADFENLLNMINKDWGSLRQVAFPYYGTLVNVACTGTTSLTTACNQYVYSNFRDPVLTNFTNISTWSLRVGARLSF
ncbi:TonB-dependent receptor [Thermaurantiacus sp.]